MSTPYIPGYTLQQAQRDIAALRGQIAHLEASATLLQVAIDTSLTVTGTTALNGASTVSQDAWSLPVQGGKVDTNTFTVTQAVLTQLTSNWTVPANDPQAGTVYRITAWGSGTQGSTQQTLTIEPMLAGSGILGGSRTTMPSTIIGASTSFNWRVVMEVQILTTGSGGTLQVSHQQTINQNTGTPAASVTYTTVQGPANTATAINTTISNTLRLSASWGSTTGAPTISSIGSMIERIGP